MSSNYYILCLSHDPATTVRELSSPASAATAVKDGVEEHAGCDLLIERVSGGPVEFGCPPHNSRPAGPRCYHSDVEWVDTEWLRLLGRAHQCDDPRLVEAVEMGRFYCWTRERLHRLRHHLGNTEEAG